MLHQEHRGQWAQCLHRHLTLPLAIPIDGNAMDTQQEFLPEIKSLGDI